MSSQQDRCVLRQEENNVPWRYHAKISRKEGKIWNLLRKEATDKGMARKQGGTTTGQRIDADTWH